MEMPIREEEKEQQALSEYCDAILSVSIIEFTLEKYEAVVADIKEAEAKKAALKMELEMKRKETKKIKDEMIMIKNMKVIDIKKNETQKDINDNDKVDVNKTGKKNTDGSNICAFFRFLSCITGHKKDV